MLQQRAIAMSLQMMAGGSGGSASSAAALHDGHPTAAVVPLSQVPDLQAAMSEGHHQGAAAAMDAALAGSGLGAVLALRPGEQHHAPGDSTPNSVTSSRVGLTWNIPSRGSVPSPAPISPAAPCSPYHLGGASAQHR